MRTPNARRACGLSLIELIVFIVIVSAAVVGVLAALSMATRSSVDPLIQKQALAIAEAVLEEVQLQPFSYCDPDDANAATALNAGSCATIVEAIGPEAGETRVNATTPFDNVNDYHGFGMSGGITNIAGSPISGLDGYAVSVTVAGQAIPAVGAGRAIPASDSLLITVTVTGPGNTSVSLHGYRARYAPNALP
ncbi:MAG: type II secretion system protein [Betaproteobacteria bacterium]|nr:type II secretion system protein [Betaproteobacteria bacterium]MDH3436802.1 type II secretion system protein [Betaproteobacteria bacterium]